MLNGRMIDHLDSVSNQLWAYLIKPANQAESLYILRAVQHEYESPKQSWTPSGFVFSYTRKRSAALAALIEMLEKNGLNANFVAKLTAFLQDKQGRWETTSVNTQLMRGLIRVMPGYDAEDDQYLTTSVVKRLVTLLDQRTKTPNLVPAPVANPMFNLAAKKQAEIKAEIKAVPKVNIADLAKQLEAFHNDSNRFKKTPMKPIKALKDNTKLSGNLGIVEGMLQGILRPVKPKEPSRKLSDNPSFVHALHTIGLFHQARGVGSSVSVNAPRGLTKIVSDKL